MSAAPWHGPPAHSAADSAPSHAIATSSKAGALGQPEFATDAGIRTRPDGKRGRSAAPLRWSRLLPGTVVAGRWRVEALRAVGGMGEVYALTAGDGDRAALKVLAAWLQGRVDLVSRMLDEGRRLGSLHHGGVVTLRDRGALEGGRPYLITELLGGITLRAQLGDTGRLATSAAAEIMAALLLALGAVHDGGLVHCDVKVDNVFRCDDGTIKLLDLGAAEPIDSQRDAADLPLIGTPRYMAPEQLAGGVLDPRTDVYGAGLLLLELLTGKPPCSSAPRPVAGPPPGSAIDRLPARARSVVQRATAPSPANRYPSALAMLRSVARLGC